MSTEYVAQGTGDPLLRLSPAQRLLRVAAAYLIALLLLTTLLAALLTRLPAVRVGDGAEYYAIALAVDQAHRPYIEAPTWEAYEQLREKRTILSLQSAEDLKAVYVPLTREGETDFNHFWFYPAVASVVGIPAKAFGLGDGPHARFMLLHALLIAGVVLLGFRLHGFKGVIAVAALILASPALWYVNKVHTELFTVVLTIAAMALGLRQRWAFAGLLLAAVTTQNISFVLPAIAACLLALIAFRTTDSSRSRIADTLALVLAAVVALLHPLYYFSRYGGFTPQLINKGADVSHLDVLSSIQYLVDPDVGLLPNWPLGIVLLAIAAHGIYTRRLTLPGPKMAVFTTVYVLAAMAAQSATANINSGGTAGPARYGLWYLCLFYPCITLLKPLPASALNRWLGRATWIIALLATALGVRDFLPTRPESYTTPSRAARLIYGHAPWLWNPSPEVFSERNAQLGELTPTGPALVIGQGCRKALYLPGPGDHLVLYPAGACGLTASAGAKLLADRFPSAVPAEPTYFSIQRDTLAGMKSMLSSLQPVGPAELSAYLGDGWSSKEPWGTWSLGKHSALRLRLQQPAVEGTQLVLRANGLWSDERQSMKVTARVNGGAWQTRVLSASEVQPAAISIALPPLPANTDVLVELTYDAPASPASLGLSTDDRELGIGLVSLALVAPPR